MAAAATETAGGIHIAARAVRLDVDAPDAAAAIRMAGEPLVEAGWVTSDYVEAAVARERAFPTALPTEPEAIAVPHADPDGVRAPAIAILRLRQPVSFVEMATADRNLPVRVILLLALQSKDQAAVLGALVRALQGEALLSFLVDSSSPAAVAERIRAVVADRHHRDLAVTPR